MSAISSATADPSLYSLLQSLSGATPQTSTSTASPASTTPDPTTAAPTQKHHGGHHHHGGAALSSQLESSISTALSSAPPGSDPNQIIQQAIQNQLEGKSPDGSPLPPTNSSINPVADPTSTAAANPQTAFSQLLQSFGVDPKSFHQDLQTAIQSGQQNGDQVDFATLFQSFPPGSAVDTVA